MERNKRTEIVIAIIGIIIAGLVFLFGEGVLLPQASDRFSNVVDGKIEETLNENNTSDTTDNNEIIPIGTSFNGQGVITNWGDVVSSHKGEVLSIQNGSYVIISDVTFGQDGFAYSITEDNATYSINPGYGFVLYGKFEYVNGVAIDESTEWGHGGILLDNIGRECYSESTSFSSNLDSMTFMVDLPEDILPGVYKYCLLHRINDLEVTAVVEFEVLE